MDGWMGRTTCIVATHKHQTHAHTPAPPTHTRTEGDDAVRVVCQVTFRDIVIECDGADCKHNVQWSAKVMDDNWPVPANCLLHFLFAAPP